MEFPNWGIPNHCHGIMSFANETPIQDMKIPFCDRGFPIYHQISMHIINIRTRTYSSLLLLLTKYCGVKLVMCDGFIAAIEI